MGVSINKGTPKTDGENNGKPYEQMDDLGGFHPPFKETSICTIRTVGFRLLDAFKKLKTSSPTGGTFRLWTDLRGVWTVTSEEDFSGAKSDLYLGNQKVLWKKLANGAW